MLELSPSLAGLFCLVQYQEVLSTSCQRPVASSRGLSGVTRDGEREEKYTKDSKAGKLFNPLAVSSCLFKNRGTRLAFVQQMVSSKKLTIFST